MFKRMTAILSLVALLAVLAGCVATPVVYNCDCDTQGQAPIPPAQGSLKTGLYITTSLSDSSDATADKDGQVKYDVTVVAVTVDSVGVIQECIIDSVPATVTFDATGAITSDIGAQILTKNELGEDYGMKKFAGSKYEWNEQAAALAAYAKGKTVDQLKNGAVNESGMAKDADLAATATIYLGGYVNAIEAAVGNAQLLGAEPGDSLRLGIIPKLGASKTGLAQLDVDVTALTLRDGVITSCYIDSLQAKVEFDATGAITTDLGKPVLTKNELGEAYGMKQYAGSKYEWNEQAAAFAAYVTGKTPAQVAGMAVTETTAPAEADLAATVTIAVGGFQALIQKAAQ